MNAIHPKFILGTFTQKLTSWCVRLLTVDCDIFFGSVNDIHTHEVEYGSDGEQNQPLDLSRQGYLDREAAYVDTQGVLGPSNKQHMLKVPSITVHR